MGAAGVQGVCLREHGLGESKSGSQAGCATCWLCRLEQSCVTPRLSVLSPIGQGQCIPCRPWLMRNNHTRHVVGAPKVGTLTVLWGSRTSLRTGCGRGLRFGVKQFLSDRHPVVTFIEYSWPLDNTVRTARVHSHPGVFSGGPHGPYPCCSRVHGWSGLCVCGTA